MISVHNRFMGLNKPIETVVHYLLIEGMTYLSHQNKILIVSTLVSTVTYWTRSMINHDLRLSSCHDSSSYYTTLTLNLKKILSLCQN